MITLTSRVLERWEPERLAKREFGIAENGVGDAVRNDGRSLLDGTLATDRDWTNMVAFELRRVVAKGDVLCDIGLRAVVVLGGWCVGAGVEVAGEPFPCDLPDAEFLAAELF